MILAEQQRGLRGDIDELKQHIAARREMLPSGAVYSHLSAALLHGLPLVTVPTTAVEIIQEGRSRSRSGWKVRNRTLPAPDTMSLGAYRVTTLERTLLDVGRDHSLTLSVPMLDSAIRKRPDLFGLLRARVPDTIMPRFRGQLPSALAVADPVRESPAESVCAVRFLEYGITGFVAQEWIEDTDGVRIARVDFCNREARVIVEVDGEAKYSLDGQDRDEAFRRERKRDYALVNEGFTVFHLRWQDLFRAQVFLQIRNLLLLATA